MAEEDSGAASAVVDIVAVVLAPLLVMAMVGSFVFFLVEVLYEGEYAFRVFWTLFFFVFGVVLISRLSIEQGRSHAALYALGLGVACYVVLNSFLFSPISSLLIMTLIWWSADRLTWDCTHFDDERRASGRGVLAASGFDSVSAPFDQENESETKTKKKKKRTEGFSGWVERFNRHREESGKRPHTPGVQVIYFALAALPIFALGQSLLPAADAERRRSVFFLAAIYVGSALALLVTTTLMGLRRYIEQRGARVPVGMTVGWLGLGGVLVAMFLLVGSLLPRPYSETPLVDISKWKGESRSASKYAPLRDSNAGKGEGAKGSKTEHDPNAADKRDGSQGSGGKNNQGESGDKKGEQPGGGSQGDEPKEKSGQQGNNKKPDENGRGEEKGNDSRTGEKQDESRQGESSSSGRDAAPAKGTFENLSEALAPVGTLFKWLVWVVVAIAFVVLILRFGIAYLANFTDWARGLLNWFDGLFQKKTRGEKAPSPNSVAPLREKRYFAECKDPFEDGGRYSLEEQIRLTFLALEVWGEERGVPRTDERTPIEFAVRIGHTFPDLDESAFRSAELYARLLYAETPPSDGRSARTTLRTLWQEMRANSR